MPLTMVSVNEPNTIIRIGGKEETRRFLENLGFVPGGVVTVISTNGGNMIVEIESRLGKIWRIKLLFKTLRDKQSS